MAPKKREEDFVPLNPTSYLILSSLCAMPKHAYAMIKDIEDVTEGRVEIGVPALYDNIKRLLEDGLIERAEDRTIAGGERRKAYRLSGFGARVLAADEAARNLVAARNSKSGLEGARS